ncbi:MBOAT family O-acyltransferase [Lachnospiraceae bacterium 46-15]
MVFSSMIFLWVFLPIIFIGYFAVQDRFKNILLLLGSLIFYAWGEPKYIMLMLCLILINYGIGIFMEKYEKQKKLLLILDVIINLGVLGYFKYFNFLIEIVSGCTGREIEFPKIVLPIGISFFTFQILSYIIDLYRGQYKAQRNIISLALYVSFFPQLIAGPIVQYKDIDEQLKHRVCTSEKTAWGIRRFIYGLGKKVIISNTVAQCVDIIYALDYENVTGLLAWIGAILYTLQIYYDFSGYSDMAIGLGKIFGFEFRENFNYPYLSSSIQEFWQRWHISLGTWFKENLYIPLGGNRKGKLRTYFNLMVVFFATGLWHGASFNFILWGLYHGLFQIIERLGFRKFLDKHGFFAHVYTVLVFVFGWTIFRADDLGQAGVMIKRMLLPWKYTESSFLAASVFGNKTAAVILAGVFGCGLLQWVLKKTRLLEKGKNSYLEISFCGMMFILCIAMLASNTYNPFIYFRF